MPDPDAPFNRLFESHYSEVIKFFGRRRYTTDECHELAQETYFRLCKKWRRDRDEKTMTPTLLFTIALNISRNDRRARAVRPQTTTQVKAILDECSRGGPENPWRASWARQRRRLVKRSIRRLPAQMRRCMVLSLEGHSHQEIAEILQISPSTVGVHVHGARRRLKQELADHFDDVSCLD